MADVVLTQDVQVGGVLAARSGDTVPQDWADAQKAEYTRPGTKKAQTAQEPDTE